jgi:hypothetical protein
MKNRLAVCGGTRWMVKFDPRLNPFVAVVGADQPVQLARARSIQRYTPTRFMVGVQRWFFLQTIIIITAAINVIITRD